jgi:hypothetical protein
MHTKRETEADAYTHKDLGANMQYQKQVAHIHN